MYQKEKSQITVHKTAADMVRRDEANKKLAFAAGNKIKPVLKQLDTALTGLGDKAVISHRIAFGRNKVTHEEKIACCKIGRGVYQSIYRNFVLPGSRIYFYRYCCTDPSACTGGCGSAYHHYNFYDGIYFRYTSVCPGIPVGECRGEAVGDDYHHLHGYKKEQREAGDPSGRFGSR